MAIGFALIEKLIDSTVKSHEPLEDLGETILGIFPFLNETREDGDLFVSAEIRSSAAECARALRTNLLFMNLDQPPQAIAVSGASPQEGKSQPFL